MPAGYIAVSRSGDKIFLSERDTVSCVTRDGEIVYRYSGEGFWLKGLYDDDNENVIVCCSWDNSTTVKIITAAGKNHKIIQNTKDGISNPHCVSFRPSDRSLVVGCHGRKNLFIYKLS